MLPSKALETLLFWDAGTSSRRRASAASSFASSSALLSFVGETTPRGAALAAALVLTSARASRRRASAASSFASMDCFVRGLGTSPTVRGGFAGAASRAGDFFASSPRRGLPRAVALGRGPAPRGAADAAALLLTSASAARRRASAAWSLTSRSCFVRGLATSPAPGPRSRRAAASVDAARAPRSAALAAALLLTSARASRRRASAAASFASTSRFVRGLATSPLARASSLARNCFCSSSMSRRTAAASRRSLSAAMDTGFAGDASFIARPGGAALSFRSSLTGTRTLFLVGVAAILSNQPLFDRGCFAPHVVQRAVQRFVIHSALNSAQALCRCTRHSRIVTPPWTCASRRPGATTMLSVAGALCVCGLARCSGVVRARSTHARATSCARTRTRKKARRLLSEKKKSTLSGNRTQGIRLEGEYVATTPIVSNPRPHLARTTTRKSIREGSRRAGDLFASPSLALLDLKSALLRSLDARNDARFRPRAAQSTVTTQPASAARQNAQAILVADAFKRCRLARGGSCRVRVAVLREQQEQGRRRPDGLQPGHHRQQQEEEVGAPRAAAFDARRQDAGAAAASLELRCRTSKIPSATLSTCEREISLRVEAFGSMNATRRRRRTRRGDEYPVIAPGSLTHRRACAPFLWHHRCQTRRPRGPSADDLDPGAAN